MKVGICDDETHIVQALTDLVGKGLKKINESAEIVPVTSGNDLIGLAKELDAVFLDIEMPEMDGFEVGRQIKSRNPSCKIIMATGRTDRFKESFKINAFRFITKPFDQNEIDEAIEEIANLKIGDEFIVLSINRIQFDVQQKEIIYLKAFNGYTEALTGEGCYRRDISLRQIRELLDDRLFFRVSKQHIVNMLYVTAFGNGKIQIGGVSVPVARRNQKEFEKRYMEFELNYRG